MSTDQSDPSARADVADAPSTSPPPDLGAARAPRPAGGRNETAGIAGQARVRIGRNLRLLYAEVLDQPLPERFEALLAELAARTDTEGSA